MRLRPVGSRSVTLQPRLPAFVVAQPLTAGSERLQHDGFVVTPQHQPRHVDIHPRIGQRSTMPAPPEGDVAAGVLQAQRVVEGEHLDQIDQRVELHVGLEGGAEIAESCGSGEHFQHGLQRGLFLPLEMHFALEMGSPLVAGEQQARREHVDPPLAPVQHQPHVLHPGALSQQQPDPEVEPLEIELAFEKLRRNPGRIRPVPAALLVLIEVKREPAETRIRDHGHTGAQAGCGIQPQLRMLDFQQRQAGFPRQRAHGEPATRHHGVEPGQSGVEFTQLYRSTRTRLQQPLDARRQLVDLGERQPQRHQQHRGQGQQHGQQGETPAAYLTQGMHRSLTSARCRTAPGNSAPRPGNESSCL